MDAGILTAYPFGESRPGTSSLNVRPRVNRAIGAIVKLGTDGGRIGFNVFVENGAHVIVDVTGYFTGPDDNLSSSGLFVPVTPVRTHGHAQGAWRQEAVVARVDPSLLHAVGLSE